MDNKLQEQLANIFSKRFEEYNTNTLKKIADTISKFKGLSSTEAHKLAQQLKYDKSYTDLIDELSKLTGQSKKEIQGLLEEVAKENIEFADTFYKARNLQTPIYEESKTLQNIVNGIADLSGSDFINIARSTGFRLLDANDKPLYLDIKDTYHKVIDECIYAINQGKDSFDNVMRKTINQLAESGVRKIEYNNEGKAKYSQRIDSAVRRNILDGIRQTTIEVNDEIAKEYDYDGWEVTVHSNPAPDHMYVQGHQFTRDEFDKFQSDQDCEDVNGIQFPATSTETNRDRRSIGQYNCYHTAFPIILGVTRPRYTGEQLQDIIDKTNVMTKIDGKEYNKYEVTQLQRQIETEIRKAKDKHIMYKKTGDNLGMLKEQKRITQLETKYKDISKKASLSEQWDRTIVDKYNPLSEKKLEKSINKVESIPKTLKYNVWNGDTIYLSKDRLGIKKDGLKDKILDIKYDIQNTTNILKSRNIDINSNERNAVILRNLERDLKKYEKMYANMEDINYKKITLNSLEDCKELLGYNNIDLKTETLQDIDLKLVKENTKQIYNLVNEYPTIRKEIARDKYVIEGYKAEDGTIAQTGLWRMQLNNSDFKDYNKMFNMVKNEVENNYFTYVKEDMYDKYIITHEIGHLTDYKMRDLYVNKNGAYYMTWEQWHRRQLDNFLDYASKKMDFSVDYIEQEYISGYGASSPAEAIAELYVNGKLGNEKIGKVFIQWLEEQLNEYN